MTRYQRPTRENSETETRLIGADPYGMCRYVSQDIEPKGETTVISNPLRTRAAALFVGAFLIVGVAACGGSGDSDSSASTTAATDERPADSSSTGADPTEEEAPAGAEVDPCQWYSAEEMGALVGFEVTMEAVETPQALGVECLYDSAAEFTSITVRPTTSASYDQLKAGAASMDIGGEQIDFPGVGDEAYHNGAADNPNPSVAFNAKSGDAGIEVELAAASGGPIATVDQAIQIASTIATTALS